ncbi:MAG TPA: folylpolyglutamate synthase/dihydrofolate synthase family protein [Terracidiphilus sp.]|nr:folylpolyglutamate synthase/dihydrofolate synthase family protein [Terracidiphilus sp.]
MSYAAAIDALNALAPELFTQPGRPRRKFSLSEIGALLEALGNPHQRFPSVLIAGTNGKGSTAATLASILVTSGLRTGLYTSPHLERPNERIRVNGIEIGDEDFARRYFTVHDIAERLIASGKLTQFPSFFETLTAMAFLHFAEARVDIAVLEVGMGGRLDATNIVDPLLSVITDISLDHTEWLGPTVSAIAREKAGILRRDGTLITLPQHPEANQAIGEVAADLNVRGVSATGYMPPANASPDAPYPVDVLGATVQIDSPLHGAHQHRNIALAIAAAAELAQQHALPISPQSIEAGIHATHWPGRLERIRIGDSQWVLDVAHNPAGAWALRAGLRPIFDAAPAHPRTLVFACLRDKPLRELAQILFPLFDRVVFAPIHSPRAATMESLLAAAESTVTPARAANSVAAALLLACPRAEDGLVVVSGSVYLVGEARGILLDGRYPFPRQGSEDSGETGGKQDGSLRP